MKILVVEDSEERNSLFREWLQGHDFKIAIDAETGLRYLQEQRYDVIFLDHDLGNRSDVDSEDLNTGYQVAKQIPTSINKDAQIIIHSINPVGSRNILAALNGKAVHRPFGDWIAAAVK